MMNLLERMQLQQYCMEKDKVRPSSWAALCLRELELLEENSHS